MLVPLDHVLPHTPSHQPLKLVRLPVPPRPRRLFSTSWKLFWGARCLLVPFWCPSGAVSFRENRPFRPTRLLPRYPQIFPQFPPLRLGLASFINPLFGALRCPFIRPTRSLDDSPREFWCPLSEATRPQPKRHGNPNSTQRQAAISEFLAQRIAPRRTEFCFELEHGAIAEFLLCPQTHEQSHTLNCVG
jgi:hypothetical protein